MPEFAMVMTEQDSVCSSYGMSIAEVSDRLHIMKHQESTSYQCSDYIDAGEVSCSSQPSRRRRRQEVSHNERHDIIDRDCRAKMCEWCYHVSDFCKFQRETVAIGMGYLDRFLATSSPRARRALHDRKEFQLVAMTTLYISIKLFEPLAMDAGLLAQISHGCYTEADVVEMEEEILKSLSWFMNGPTAHAFLSHILALLPPSAYRYDEATLMTLLDFSKFQAEIAVADYDLSLQKPSTVALAALLNSIEGIEMRLFPAESRFHFFKLIADASGINPFSRQINAVRARLLQLFSENSGYELPQIANLTPVVHSSEQCFNKGQMLYHDNDAMHSSICVARQSFTADLDSYSAKCA